MLLASVALANLAALAQYAIYPVPQQMTAGSGTAQFSEEVCLVADKGIDAATISRAQQILKDHGLNGQVATGEKACTSVIYLKVDASVAKDKKFDAHKLSLKAQGDGMVSLTITGQHTDATFYGLASLEQMLEEKGTSQLPCVEIYDWADQQSRGLVEGYYGYPYSVAVKKDLMRFMMRLKMNTYLYGAKSDPYHSQSWKDPYPTKISAEEEQGGWMTQDMIKDVCEVSHATKVNFIWAIHPGNAFVSSSTVNDDIMKKFQNMHSLGVRQFAVFVDDVGVPSTDADMKTNADRLTDLQHRIEATFNGAGKAAVDTVKPLHFVPQIYCRGFAGSEDQFQRFFKALSTTPKNVTVYTTGWGVWSVPNVSDYNNTAQYLGREVAWWWNYPCNDNSDAQIYPMDMYQNFVDLPQINGNSRLPESMEDRGMGIVSNPMQQGEVAKTALFSVADYAWHCAGFDNMKSWEASFRHVLPNPDYAAAYKTVAPFLTTNDPTSGTTAITTSLTAASAPKRIDPLLEAVEVLISMKDSERESDRLLYGDLKPWLLKLKQMLVTAKQFFATKAYTNSVNGELNEEKWLSYVQALTNLEDLDENPDYIVKTLEGMNYRNVGSHLVKPANKALMATLNALRTSVIKGFAPTVGKANKFVTNTTATGSAATAEGKVYLSLSATPLQPQQYVGVTMPEARPITLEVQDSLYNGRAIWVSTDGKEWSVVEKGQQPEIAVRHLIIINTSDKTQAIKLAKGVIAIEQQQDPTITEVGVPSGDEYKDHERKFLTDGDYNTWFTMNANQKTGDTYTLTLSDEAALRTVRVAIGTTNQDYMTTGRIEISKDGKTWTKLAVAGKTKTTFNIDDMQKLSDEAKVLDFDAKGQKARYVRLYNQQANTSKWLRIYEIEPIYAVAVAPAEDGANSPLSLAVDGQADTYCVPSKKVDYHLMQLNDAERITFLTNKGVEVFDLSENPRTNLFTYTWEGTEAPKVYEIFVTESATKHDVTGIDEVRLEELISNAAEQRNATFDILGRKVTDHATAKSTHGVLIQNGKKIIR